MSANAVKCEHCAEHLECYIGGDLSEEQARAVAYHLAECEPCARRYSEMRALAAGLRRLGDSYEPAESFVAAGKPSQAAGTPLWQAVAAAAAVIAVVSMSALSIPALAEQLPLPVGRHVAELRDERDALSERIARLEVQLREIDGEQVPVVRTVAEELSTAENEAIQRLSMQFIRAQYDGDIAELKALSTPRLAAQIDRAPDTYVRPTGEFVFAQMTEVAREDDEYLVFVRLSDSEFPDSSYQLNVTVVKSGASYLVDAADMDA